MARSTSELREAWKDWECNANAMTMIDFGPDRIRVTPVTKDAWTALAKVIEAHDYQIRTSDTDSYNCRTITGGTGRSLHAFGIALDVNWGSNPYQKTPDGRKVRFSLKPTQQERALDVKAGKADTDMTAAMIANILAIKTVDGKQVFTWGGAWNTVKDTMHFQLDLTPAEMSRGIDWTTVVDARGAGTPPAGEGIVLEVGGEDDELESGEESGAAVRVTALSLNMRLGPSVEQPQIGQVQLGQVLEVVARKRDAEGNEWIAVKAWVADTYHGKRFVEPR